MRRSKFIAAMWFSMLAIISTVALTTTASAQSCSSVCTGQSDGTSCSCSSVSPSADGQCMSETCHAAGIYVFETASIDGFPSIGFGGGCTDSYRLCSQDCLDVNGGSCNNEDGFVQSQDAETSGGSSENLIAEGTALAACAEAVGGLGLNLWKDLGCLLKGVGIAYKWKGSWSPPESCPDYAPSTNRGQKMVAVLTDGHPSYEDVNTHTCKFCRCQVDCTGQIADINWTTRVGNPHVFDRRGVQIISLPGRDVGSPSEDSCESRLAKISTSFNPLAGRIDYTAKLDSIYEATCQQYCQQTAANNCRWQVGSASVPDGAAWGWCANSSTSAPQTKQKGSPIITTHHKCLVEADIPDGPDDTSQEWKWGCGRSGDPWNYSIDGAVWDCSKPSEKHVSWRCHSDNVMDVTDGRSESTSNNLASGTDEKECLNYRCDGSEQCADGTDCGDCASACDCLEVCDDGFDNDRNGDIDCDDSVCDPNCGCTDSTATNYDSTKLYDDGSCTFPEVECADNIDNDGNGDIDCDDAACQPDCGCTDPNADNYDPAKLYDDGSCTYSETDCADGIDNDGNGDIDCADAGCSTDPNCSESGRCDDGVDNDGDGDTDCDDSDCAGEPECMEMGQCDDGVDNDGDGDTDCDDSDCSGDPACMEMGHCDDGLDNDGDGDIDCDDSDCSGDPACMEMGHCDDGLDNDGDGDTDCDDSDCAGDPACMDMGTPDVGPGPDPDAGVPDAEPTLDAEMTPMGCVYEDYRCTPGTTVGLDRCHEDGNGQVTWISVPRESDCSSFPSYRCRNSNDNPGPGESYGAYCTER